MNETRELETPRFCTTEQLAEAFGFSPHWIYKLNKRGKGPPRLKGVRPYRYDTQSREFSKWLEDMGVDIGGIEPLTASKRTMYRLLPKQDTGYNKGDL